MDVETFLKETRGSVTNLITKELQDLDLAKVQTTAWIQLRPLKSMRLENHSIIG